MSITYQLSIFAQQISNPNTDPETIRAIYETVRLDTQNFTIYPNESQRFIDIIRSNGQQASRAKKFSTFIIEHSLILLASAGGITGGIITKYSTTFPMWAGAIAGTGICIVGKILLNPLLISQRKENNVVEIQQENPQNPLQVHPTAFIANSQITSPSSSSARQAEETKAAAELQRAIALSLEPLQRPTCPISLEEIPPGQEFKIGNEIFNINYLMSAILSMEPDENEQPINPMNRQPLTNEDLQRICRYYNIFVEDLLNLYKKDSSILILVEAQLDIEISNIDAFLSFEEQTQRVEEIQNSFSDKKRDIRKESFIELIRSNNSCNPKVVETFITATE